MAGTSKVEQSSVGSRAQATVAARTGPQRMTVAGVKSRLETVRERAIHLVELARGRERALVVTHDNPDPDCIAAALALAQIFAERADVPTTIAYGGIVGRSENRALVKVLRLPVVPLSRVNFEDYDLICLVDTQPEMGNHSLPPRFFPDVIFDHHPERPESHLAAHPEVGGDYGATSTIAAEYLRALGMKPNRQVATALFYGIKADTRDLGRETEDADVEAYLWLFPYVDKEALGQIEHPRLPAEYFRLYHTATERARVHGNVVIADLGEIYAPDMVAEVAERHLFLEGIKWSLAFGAYKDNLYFSLRTNDRRMNAGRLIREVCEEFGGTAGGHGQMAGARIPVDQLTPAQQEELKKQVVKRFCAEFGVRARNGVPLLEYDPDED